MMVDVTWATAWVRGSARTVFEHRDELIELDRQIGDGDHGENLARGFTAVLARLDALETPPADIGEVLRLVATTLMSTVGGAAGPLYGTAYLRAAKVTGFAELDGAGVVAMLEAGLEGIVVRGKASPGEKTMSSSIVVTGLPISFLRAGVNSSWSMWPVRKVRTISPCSISASVHRQSSGPLFEAAMNQRPGLSADRSRMRGKPSNRIDIRVARLRTTKNPVILASGPTVAVWIGGAANDLGFEMSAPPLRSMS